MTAYRATSLLKNMEPQGSIFVAGAAGGVGGFALQFIRHFYSDAIFTVAGSEKTQAFLEKQLGVHQEHITRYKDQTTEALAEKLIMLNGGSRFFC